MRTVQPATEHGFCTLSLSKSINSQITLGVCHLSPLAAIFHELSIFAAVLVHVVAFDQVLSEIGCHDGTTNHRTWLLLKLTKVELILVNSMTLKHLLSVVVFFISIIIGHFQSYHIF